VDVPHRQRRDKDIHRTSKRVANPKEPTAKKGHRPVERSAGKGITAAGQRYGGAESTDVNIAAIHDSPGYISSMPMKSAK